MAYTYDTVQAAGALLTVMEHRLRPDGPEHRPTVHHGISLGLAHFLGGMEVVNDHVRPMRPDYRGGRQARFLDVGCGIGSKLVMAAAMNYDPFGIEFWEPYVEAASKMVPRAWLERIDAMDFKYYDQFDVVYLYKPFKDDELESALERYIVDNMRTGAVLFAVSGTYYREGMTELAGNVWLKGNQR